MNEPAERAARDLKPRVSDEWMHGKILVETDREIRLPRRLLNCIGAGECEGGRLFDEDVAASPQCLKREGLVRIRRREDVDNVRLRLCVERIPIVEVAAYLKAAGKLGRALVTRIQHAAERDIRQLPQGSGVRR